LSETTVNPNFYEVLKVLFESTEPLAEAKIQSRLNGMTTEPPCRWTQGRRWNKRDIERPSGFWNEPQVSGALKELVALKLISIKFSEGWAPRPRYYLDESQRQRFKTILVVKSPTKTKGPRGRPKLYASDAERQTARRKQWQEASIRYRRNSLGKSSS